MKLLLLSLLVLSGSFSKRRFMVASLNVWRRPLMASLSRLSKARRPTSTRLFSDTVDWDEEGRRVRKRRPANSDNNDWGNPPAARNNDSWADFDPTVPPAPISGDTWPGKKDSYNRYDDEWSGGSKSRSSSRNRSPPRRSSHNQHRGGRDQRFRKKDVAPERRININALQQAGFCHLYGFSPVWNALQADRRDFLQPEQDDEDEESVQILRERKPEAQFVPWLFVQEKSRGRDKKQARVDRLTALATERGVPVATVDKGVLNTLSANRPHQGFVLRCGQLDWEPLSRIPFSMDDDDGDTLSSAPLWVVLDQVVDPQNLGALLRSAQFLGHDKKIRCVVCTKNSAPPSPVVSAASAGALEVMTVYSTTNLPRTLAAAAEDGFRILGASVAAEAVPLPDLKASLPGQPTILVLGSEGRGIRTLVERQCTELVTIPGGGEPQSAGDMEAEEDEESIDSLNVSVSGGILLWHLSQLNSSQR